jgi:hypothetical protein
MKKTTYSITIAELVKRPIIRKDFYEEWMNKMTDEELDIRDDETHQICKESGMLETLADMPVAYLTKQIDTTIMYNLVKSGRISLSSEK